MSNSKFMCDKRHGNKIVLNFLLNKQKNLMNQVNFWIFFYKKKFDQDYNSELNFDHKPSRKIICMLYMKLKFMTLNTMYKNFNLT